MININQHNYEAFFLLYVDGELSATDKLAVDQFVQANPDLASELAMLMDMRLPEESILFGDKDSLFRKESAEVNLQNYEEQFLLYVDNELAPIEKEKVETFVLQHPSLQENFTQLKHTKLPLESMVFANKESLYRKEEKEKPVFYMRWQRVAIAAVLTGIAVLLWTVIPQNNTDQSLLAKNDRRLQPTDTKKQSDKPNALPTDINKTEADQIPNTQIASINNPNAISSKRVELLQQPVSGNTLPANNETNDAIASAPVKTTDIAKADLIASVVNNGSETASTQRVSGDNATLENTELVRTNSGPSDESVLDNIQPAAYRELDTESADQKKSLLLGSLEINKDKLRGFFRKAGSIFRSKSKADDDKTEIRPASTRSLK